MTNDNVKVYSNCKRTVQELIEYMYNYLETDQNLEVQRVQESNITMLQARSKHRIYKKIFGLDKAVILKFTDSPDGITVEIFETKLSNAVWTPYTEFILCPSLSVTTCVGVYNQLKLIEDLKIEMDSYMLTPIISNNNEMKVLSAEKNNDIASYTQSVNINIENLNDDIYKKIKTKSTSSKNSITKEEKEKNI